MKKNYLFFLLLLLSFVGCQKFPPYKVTIKGRAETVDGKPLANYDIICKQSLFARTTWARTDSSGRFVLSLTTSWDESTTDKFQVTGETKDSLMCISKEEVTLLQKNESVELVMIFDKMKEQKVRFVSTSNRLQRFLFDMEHHFMSKGAPNIIPERLETPNTFFGTNVINVDFKAKDTTITFQTGKNMKFHFRSNVSLINPIEEKLYKAVVYNYKENRPDTMIVVRF
jgi:hypothetical protein